MEQNKIVFLLDNNNKWYKLISHIQVLLKFKDIIKSIAVVITDTAILSCLKNSKLEYFKTEFNSLIQNHIDFWICTNTLNKYSIQKDMLLDNIQIAEKGGIMKVIELESNGYILIPQ